MKKFLLFLLAVAAMAAGCSKNDGTPPVSLPEGDGIQIAVHGKALTVGTKAPFEGAISGGNTLKALVLATQTTGDYTAAYAKGTMTFSDESSTVGYDDANFTGSKAYPAGGSNLYLAGLSPCDGQYTGLDWSVAGTTAAYTFSGVEDVMAAPQVTTTKTNAEAGSYPTLAFAHQLTLLEIQIVAEDASAASAWGSLQDVKLTGSFNNVATVTLNSGTAAFSGSVADWPFYDAATNAPVAGATIAIPAAADNTSDEKIKESARKVGYTMAAPIIATGTNDFTIAVKSLPSGGVSTTKTGIKINLRGTDGNVFSGDTKGKKFLITLIFRAKDIQAVGSVTEWETGGSADADVD